MKKKEIDMLNGGCTKTILRFALPIMLTSLLQYNYSLVDNIIVGRYVSADALAAVGNVGSIGAFIIGAALGLTAGFTIPVAHAFGAKDFNKLNHFAGSSITLSILIGTIIVIVAHIISRPLLLVIDTPSEIIDISASYINILYFGVPLQMLSNNFNAISRSVGESKKPLYFYICSVIVNFILDLLFVKHMGLGVEGAAYATLISYGVVALLTGTYVLKYNPNVNVTKDDLKPHIKTMWKQIKLGIPVSLQFTITSIGSMCMQRAINSFGPAVMAGLTAALRVENLTNIPMSGLGVATQTFVGQNYGAKNYDRIIRSVRKIFILEIFISIIMSITLYLIGPSFVTLFTSEANPEMMAAAKRYFIAIAECYSMVAILFILRNTLQGLGFTYSNTIAGAGELFGRMSVAFILTPLVGFAGICYAAPAAWLLADIPLCIIYLSKQRKFKILAQKQKEVQI